MAALLGAWSPLPVAPSHKGLDKRLGLRGEPKLASFSHEFSHSANLIADLYLLSNNVRLPNSERPNNQDISRIVS